MTTTITQTIGATGRQFSTLQAWEDALPANTVTAEKSAAGTFLVAAYTLGENLTFVGSGATGKFIATDSTGAGNGTYIIYSIVSGNPAASDVVTGGSSGATCVLSSGTPIDTGVAMVGACYNDAEFGAQLTISGQTTDVTNNITLKCGTNQSFYDNASKLTNALKYNVSNGVGINIPSNFGITISSLNVILDGLQIKAQFDNRGIISSDNSQIIKRCIIETGSTGTGGGTCNATGGIYINCLIIGTGGGAGWLSLGSNAECYNCTIVQTNPGGGVGKGVRRNYDTPTCLNVVAMNFAGGAFQSGLNAASDYCAADDTSAPGAHSVQSLTFSTQFQNTAAGDFRAVSSGSLDNSGTPDSTHTGGIDILGQTRSVTTPTIGCFEVVAGGGGRTTKNIRSGPGTLRLNLGITKRKV